MTSTTAPDDLLLAEELLLLALHDDKGHDTTKGADGGLAGALLLDLAAAGWLDHVDGKLVPAAVPPLGSAPAGVLADALAAIRAERKPRSAKHWVRKLPDELRPIKGRGDVIGELALLQGGTRSVSVRARRDSELIELARTQFETLLRGAPTFALTLTRTLGSRMGAAPAAVGLHVSPSRPDPR